RHPPARPRTRRQDPVGRQPAEGRARSLGARQPQAAPARRADPGRRRGRQGRAVRGHPRTGRQRHRRAAGLQRGAGGARPGRPRAGGARGIRHPRGRRPRTRRAPRTGHDHEREGCLMSDPTKPRTDTGPPGLATARQAVANPLGRLIEGGHVGLLVAIALLVVVGLVTRPDALGTTSNLISSLSLAATIGVITVGATFVIIGGGIDLSVGAVMALSSVWATTVATQEFGPVVMAICAILVGTGTGLVNGILIAYGRLVPFIATLAMLVAARGLAQRM